MTTSQFILFHRIRMLSQEECNRWSVASKQRVEIDQPPIVKDYNCYMSGVDLWDMMIKLYQTNIRSNKWYMRIVYYCIDLAVVNSGYFTAGT